MSPDKVTVKEETVAEPVPVAPLPVDVSVEAAKPSDKKQLRRGRSGERRGGRREGHRENRIKPEFDQKLLAIRRVARVVSGGRRFSFSVAMVVGNRKGKVAVGTGKAGDTALAIEKAYTHAKKHILVLNLTKTSSIPEPLYAKFSSSEVQILPSPGRGLVAGSSVRTVLELAGVKDVNAKILSGSKNRLNNARAALEALRSLSVRVRPDKVEPAASKVLVPDTRVIPEAVS